MHSKSPARTLFFCDKQVERNFHRFHRLEHKLKLERILCVFQIVFAKLNKQRFFYLLLVLGRNVFKRVLEDVIFRGILNSFKSNLHKL